MPSLSLIDKKEKINGKIVGQYALDEDSSRIVFIKWGTLFRKYDSFSFTGEFLDGIDAEIIYIVDKDSGEVFRFTKTQYQEGPMVKEKGDYQYVLPKEEFLEKFESLDEVLE